MQRTLNSVMKKSLLALAASGLLMAAAPSYAHFGHCKDTELGELMTGMKDDLKGYVAAFKQSDNAAMQQKLDRMIATTVKAKNHVPLKLQDEMPMAQMMGNGQMSAEEHAKLMQSGQMSAEQHAQMMGNSQAGQMGHMMGNGQMSAEEHAKLMQSGQMSAEQHARMMGNSQAGPMNNAMPGMSHATHMQHMRYLQGIDKLNGLFRDLKAAGDDRAQVKALLGEIKQHSKSSHEAFRKECEPQEKAG